MLSNKFIFMLVIYTFILYIFNSQLFYQVNKNCLNDALLSLHILSSSVLTLCFLCVLIYYVFLEFNSTLNQLYINMYIIIIFYFCLHNANYNFAFNWIITQNIT